MIWLAKNITFDEMIFSEYATRNRINNTPPDELIQNIAKTAAALQVIRAYWRRPVIISSGYRCSSLNEAIGGSDRSHHCLGLAVDFIIPGVHLNDIIKSIQNLLHFDQLINEYGRWVHLSVHPKSRGEVFNV